MTIRDVAKRAGVSDATVSLVLNDHVGRVSQMTREKVLDAVKALDYTPNSIARSLAGRATRTIGLVVSDVVRAPFSSAIKGVEASAMRFGYQVMLCNMNGDSKRLARATDALIENRVDGIVFALSSRIHPELPVSRLLRQNVPFALVNHTLDIDDIPSVLIDNASGTRELTRQLIELGHRRIGCLHLPVDGGDAIKAAEERLNGYMTALSEKGVSPNPSIIREGAWGEVHGEAVGYRLAYELLSTPDRPTALVCCNDYMAIGAIRACEKLGLIVPRDVAVVGHDNVPGSAYVTPALTTVEQPMTEAGKRATHILAHMIRQRAGERALSGTKVTSERQAELAATEFDFEGGGDGGSFVVNLPCSLVIRSSSGHFPRQ